MRDFLWFPQLDLYDTVRRHLLIASKFAVDGNLGREQLFIIDFFLANPSLLHRTKMTLVGREAFRALEVPRDSFLQLPPAPILFERMSGTETLSLQNLIGRGALQIDAVKSDSIRLSPIGLTLSAVASVTSPAESMLIDFLTGPFLDLADPGALRNATGLRRVLT